MKKLLIILILLILAGAGLFFWKYETEKPMPAQAKFMFKIESSAFGEGEMIPAKYTCDGEGINPTLKFSDLPDGTKSLALIADDPDATTGTFIHWTIWNIDPTTPYIAEGNAAQGSVEGKNSSGKIGYAPPCPPSGTHRYFFRGYALDTTLNLPERSSRSDLEKAMEGHIVGEGELMGKYGK
jgi:Raf kinase inhibitor-like YbhB/YbcL family protein